MKDNKITQHANLIALFAGLIFVSHPLQTEAVTYIVQRAASMATLFYVATLCLYVKSRLVQDTRMKIYYIGSLLTAVVAMFTKEIAITLPLMILLYEFSFFKPNRNYLTPFFLTLFIIPITMLFTHNESINFQEIQGAMKGAMGISPMHYLLTQFRVMVTYIRLVFLPLNQNLDYDYPVFESIFELPVLISFLFLVSILYFAKRLFSKYRLVSFAIFWFFLTLLPESSLFPIHDVIFEHRLYLPLVGYSMFLVCSVYYLFGNNSIRTMVIVLTMIVGCNSVLTYQRNKVWKDEFTLWDDTVKKSPYKARPYNNRGFAYDKQGNFTQAISDYNKAIGLNPEYAEAYTNRGVAYAKQNNFTQAMPDFIKAIELNPKLAAVYNNRAVVYYKLKKYDEAWADVHKAQYLGAAVNPGFLKALAQASGRHK
jgi:tetratricopeptide (TPR) repeat protein